MANAQKLAELGVGLAALGLTIGVVGKIGQKVVNAPKKGKAKKSNGIDFLS